MDYTELEILYGGLNMKDITITVPLDDWRAVCRALKCRANRWYKESDSTKDDDRAASAFRIGQRYDGLADKVEEVISNDLLCNSSGAV